MGTGNIVEGIHVISKDCINTPIDDLVSRPEWGEINFENLRPMLKMFFNISKDLLDLPINLLSEEVLNRIYERVTDLQQIINAIKNFDLKTRAPSERQTKISEHFTRNVGRLIVEACPFLIYLAYSEGGTKKYIDELADVKTSIEQILTDTKQHVETKTNEIAGIMTVARKGSASAGISKFATDFTAEAKNIRFRSKLWLVATMLFGGATIAMAYQFYLDGKTLTLINPNENIYVITHLITTKLIVLGMLFSATLWCAKIYKALMHQAAVTRHRANSIQTFQTFVNAASDDAVRDAVLMEATKTIFEHTSTGYLEKESGDSKHGQVKVVEVVKKTQEALTPSPE